MAVSSININVFRSTRHTLLLFAAFIILTYLYFFSTSFAYPRFNEEPTQNATPSTHGDDSEKGQEIIVTNWRTRTEIQVETETIAITKLLQPSQTTIPNANSDPNSNNANQDNPNLLPEVYIRPLHEPNHEWCETRFGVTYLETAAKNARPFCKPSSRSKFDCLHTQMHNEQRKDNYCIARNVVWNGDRFNVDCDERDWNSSPDLRDTPSLRSFEESWYHTGPKFIINHWAHIDNGIAKAYFDQTVCKDDSSTRDDKIYVLIKREGGTNYWHSLMEVFSFYFTIDTLTMAVDPITSKPYLSGEDLSKVQVIVLDDYKNKNYFELYNAFNSSLPAIHINEWKETRKTDSPCLSNVIIPLPGASNPFWQADWEARDCTRSPLADGLRTRILTHLDIPLQRHKSDSKIRLTYMDRRGSRKLIGQQQMLDELIATYPSVDVNIVDFGKMAFSAQLEIISQTDILVGVHGAGHTHGFFLPDQSSIVEILPQDLEHRGFRNLAALRGLRYFSDHATKVDPQADKDWHAEDVKYDAGAFMKLMEAAIQSVSHRGLLDIDVA